MPRQAQKREARRLGNRCLLDCPREPHITVHDHAYGTTIALKRLDKGLSSYFSGEIGSHLGIEQHRGAEVWDGEGLHPMRPLALWLGGDGAHVFAIGLPDRHGRVALFDQRVGRLGWMSAT